MNKWRFIVVIIMLLGVIDKASAQQPDFAPLRSKIQNWVDSGYYTGASLVVVKDGEECFRGYFGNYEPNTVAYIASAGKWLAATTIAAVVEEGKLGWDDPVNKWLPFFKGVTGTATLRQLMSHTAGFQDYQPKGQRPDNYQSLDSAVAHIAALGPDGLPGEKFKYGGLAMQVAGRMAELATGKDWETIFQEKIARPLGMRFTHFTPVDETPGHNPMIGGGARASLDDYAHFLSMIINNGRYNGKRILTARSVAFLQADQVSAALVPEGEFVERARGSKRKDIYGLGEWREEVNERGEAILISSPSWAGAYPWIDKKNKVYGFFLARVSDAKNGFLPFYASPVIPMLVRGILERPTSFDQKMKQ
jgi:CubicO group peptidase (beta-lactamase class C family)